MTNEKKPRGFAAMTPEKRAEISRKGGIEAHKRGTAHKWTKEEASEMGKLGGKAVHEKYKP